VFLEGIFDSHCSDTFAVALSLSRNSLQFVVDEQTTTVHANSRSYCVVVRTAKNERRKKRQQKN